MLTSRPGWATRDMALVLGARAVRGFGLGAISVLIGVYLERRGLSDAEVGGIIAASLAGGAAGSLAASALADRMGRRRYLVLLGAIAAAAALAFPFTGALPLMIVLAFLGNLAASGQDAFVTIEHAIVPQTCPPREWNNAFAAYSLVGSFAAALGALASAIPGLIEGDDSGGGLWAFKAMFLACGGLILAAIACYQRLSPSAEIATQTQAGQRPGVRVTGRLARLTALFAIDGFGGGLVVQSFMSYWLHRKFDVPLEELALIFFIGGSLTGLSFPVAAWLANRIGQIPTMVFTHLPANIFLVLVPVMPAAAPAIALLLARLALSAMDVPARQAYIVAMVRPEQRTTAVAITGVARNLTTVPGPSIAGAMAQAGFLSLPVYLGGALKIVYDLALYAMFRDVRPEAPEGATHHDQTGRGRTDG